MEPFKITYPTAPRVPVLLSIPHCGTEIPEYLALTMHRELVQFPDDTDWYLDQLYDFAPSLGITVIQSVYSRFVIDLNRDPSGEPLYHDDRVITELCPTHTFMKEPVYRYDVPDQLEIERRKNQYFDPYHNKINELLQEMKTLYGDVLLFDAHSIRQEVETIHPDPFPDFILGDNRRTSADPELIQTAMRILSMSDYATAHNFLFKGGYITRHYGNPDQYVHALQLEMTKENYMSHFEKEYDPEKAEKVKAVLKNLLNALIKAVNNL